MSLLVVRYVVGDGPEGEFRFKTQGDIRVFSQCSAKVMGSAPPHSSDENHFIAHSKELS